MAMYSPTFQSSFPGYSQFPSGLNKPKLDYDKIKTRFYPIEKYDVVSLIGQQESQKEKKGETKDNQNDDG